MRMIDVDEINEITVNKMANIVEHLHRSIYENDVEPVNGLYEMHGAICGILNFRKELVVRIERESK
jgi:hypothetical protein